MQEQNVAHEQDFTVDHYRKLLELAKTRYKFTSFLNISLNQPFILWRHDVDLSLNRSARLAAIEKDVGVAATYFVNPHSEFYNLFERSQTQLVRTILDCGHELALHLDADYFDVRSEAALDDIVAREARTLTEYLGVAPTAVSFHNPREFLLTCERDTYGGLINCYSNWFKTMVPYVSDSNGTWRFARLWDELAHGRHPRLQVLTHPGWWQDSPMAPRLRVARCCYGRAAATLREYDAFLSRHERTNLAGGITNLWFLKESHPELFEDLTYLWQRGRMNLVHTELNRLLLSKSPNIDNAVAPPDLEAAVLRLAEQLQQVMPHTSARE